AALSEQLGFIGAGIILLLYAVLILRIIRIGMHCTNNFGKFTALGIAVLLLIHIFINIGMNLGKFPVTGIPLPLMSYGGSATLMTLIGLGIVQSIGSSRKSIDIADNLMLRSRSLQLT
ncbi:MAG TPA: FtsW/RodA/SpoVE family cell cycle protein, partial [Candidatus Dojkabacteria bacterium]|nr:FtsW/RodA/SpoVE family cell cycle protein [Candidatus Dojkabacteria bacterium]